VHTTADSESPNVQPADEAGVWKNAAVHRREKVSTNRYITL
jgi:hypothetical protein